MRLEKPSKLNKGDTVALITLSAGAAGEYPGAYEWGKQLLAQELGLNVIETPNARRDPYWIKDNPQARLDDLVWAFSNQRVRAIISIVGGNDSIRLLDHVDETVFSAIRNNPKIFLGYSDTTVSHYICRRAGLATFYGPDLWGSFLRKDGLHPYTKRSMQGILFSNEEVGNVEQWQDGWHFISGKGSVQGQLIGGCADIIQVLTGTTIWPGPTGFADKILFLETPEENLNPDAFKLFLRSLWAQRVLPVIKGLLFSKPGTEEHRGNSVDYEQVILEVLRDYGREDMPVITNMDFGHTVPQMTIPFGCLAEINVEHQKLTIRDNATA